MHQKPPARYDRPLSVMANALVDKAFTSHRLASTHVSFSSASVSSKPYRFASGHLMISPSCPSLVALSSAPRATCILFFPSGLRVGAGVAGRTKPSQGAVLASLVHWKCSNKSISYNLAIHFEKYKTLFHGINVSSKWHTPIGIEI